MKQQGLTSVRTGKLEDNDAFKPLKYKIKSLRNTEADGKNGIVRNNNCSTISVSVTFRDHLKSH